MDPLQIHEGGNHLGDAGMTSGVQGTQKTALGAEGEQKGSRSLLGRRLDMGGWSPPAVVSTVLLMVKGFYCH
ncbi:hypothetical protein PBY51_020913 [Eleginops maclovinus]|uniref:Uncharacterized protein n=1 Tax=Eleginops maclovinus TaxID=56733 RepID=A0AAN7XEM9_ELEMC|nr:hypothetical protein PBY51_020913 [Eleginops maclovinus]